MSRIVTLVALSSIFALVIVACSERDEEGAPSSEPPPVETASAEAESDSDPEAAIARARALAKAVGGGLKTRLVEAMGQGGPEAAISVCADEAMTITRAAVSDGEAAGRASTKLRNPANAGPEWVRHWLAEQGPVASDAAPFAQVNDGRARVIMPIAVEGVCLNCHGAADAIAPEVRAVLAERYADDQATGYAEGDLRGALWAEVPLR